MTTAVVSPSVTLRKSSHTADGCISIPYVYALKPGGDIEGVHPLNLHRSRIAEMDDDDEALEIARVRVVDLVRFEDDPTPKSDHPLLDAYIPTTDAMGSAAPKGEYAVFTYREPKDGEIVAAYVTVRRAPRLRWMDRLMHWRIARKRRGVNPWWNDELSLDEMRRLGAKTRFVIRRFGHDAQGREILTAEIPGWHLWTRGEGIDGLDTDFFISGVLAPYKAMMHGEHEVFVRLVEIDVA